MSQAAHLPFRHLPPDPRPGVVRRERLLEALRLRFDRRLTVVVGSAGFGKTTLLAQAVAENALDPIGIDVWFVAMSRDQHPEHLIAGLSTSLLGDPDAASDVQGLVDAVWSQTPRQVAIIVDDAHLLESQAAWKVLADLLEALPANAHLVLGTRTAPPLPMRVLQARGDVVVVDQSALAFTSDELDEFARLAGSETPTAETLPTWPALAVLTTTVGREASMDFLWEAVLASIDEERRTALALMVRFERIDDALVNEVLGDRWSARQLVSGLPLIEWSADALRFHDLWQDALADVVPPSEWKAALARGAEALLGRGELVRAVACLRAAGNSPRMVEVVRRFASSSISAGLSAADADLLAALLPPDEQDGPLGIYLTAVRLGTFHAEHFERELESVHRAAVERGDDEMRVLALWRLAQHRGDTAPNTLEVTPELEALAADGWPLARSAVALATSYQAQQRRDIPAALAVIDQFEAPDPITKRTTITSRLLQLGQPEKVPVTLEEVLADGVSDPVAAQAVWLRGDIDPTVAWPIAAGLPALYDVRRLDHVQVALLGVVTSVALAAGDREGASRLAAAARSRSSGVIERYRQFAGVADALVVLANGDEAGFVERLESMLEAVPLDPWPAWAYLGALMPIRALVPGAVTLDELQLGPLMKVGVDAGRALRSLRDDADVAPAAALPWDRPSLMRVHLPAPMLCELALAAATVNPSAATMLDLVPDASHWVHGLVEHPVQAVRDQAVARSLDSPVRPTYEVRITTFGQLSVQRSDGVAVIERGRSGRVLQLVAHLVVSSRLSRRQVAEVMWPDVPTKQALMNLRVTLGALLDTLEPNRAPQTSWFVRTDNGVLTLGTDGVSIDLRDFEHHVAAARQAERNSVPTAALEHHAAAFVLYAGEFMPGIDAESVVHERARLQTLAYHSGCRVAELWLARGEPETALRYAVDAQRIDPLGERAQRMEILCHLTLGSTTSARSKARSLRELFAAERLTPDRETELLLQRVDP